MSSEVLEFYVKECKRLNSEVDALANALSAFNERYPNHSTEMCVIENIMARLGYSCRLPKYMRVPIVPAYLE